LLHRSLTRGITALAALTMSLMLVASATAAPFDDGVAIGGGQQHGTDLGHLPAVSSNIDLVSKLEASQPFGDVLPGQVADVTVHKGYAYLASWSPKDDPADESCRRGGTIINDIRDVKNPKYVGFVPALAGNYHGEGMHAISVKTGAFTGDLLAVNNETCVADNNTLAAGGGFDLLDVSDPANPKVLVTGFGDRGGEGSLTGTEKIASEYHSVFLWQDGGKVYLVGVDNDEAHDVDFYDVSDPRNPVGIAEFDLLQTFPQIEDGSALGDGIFHHDMTVKEIDGVQTMIASYWDAGYVLLNVENPAAPAYIGDTSFDGPDPLTGFTPQTGNGHYAEFSHDNKFLLTADEDFDYRFTVELEDGPNAGILGYEAGTADAGRPIGPDSPLEGDTRFVGQGCTVEDIAPAGAPNMIAVLERGTCSFGQKVVNADAAGYAGAVIFNNATGGTAQCDGLINMTLAGPPEYTGDIPSIFVGRSVGFKIIDAYDAATYRCTPGDATSTPAPAAPREGSTLSARVDFDAFGYAHLYQRGAGKLAATSHYAVDEALDPRFGQGFGDLSIHEWAADPTEDLGYASYYAAGIRVASFGDGVLKETGRFIDEGGSNFWGVEQFTGPDGERYIAGSDRDYGLYILRYTGPGAAKPPVCQDVTVTTDYGRTVTVPLKCTDVNGNTLTISIDDTPNRGTLGIIDRTKNPNVVSYTPRANAKGAGFEDTFTFHASDGSAVSPLATARIRVNPEPNAQCQAQIIGTAGKDVINGTIYGDLLTGLGGDDVLDGLEGRDCLEGGPGNDRLLGGTNDDRLNGHTGSDNLNGGPGNDRLTGASGNDFLGGGSNNDRLTGGSGRDSLRGEAGNDSISGGSGDDRLDGGKGRNVLSGGAGNDRHFAANGQRDRIRCGTGRDSVSADRIDSVAKDCERVTRTRRTT
jgi:Ca2+-binding RTX toxin-like protein